MAPAVVQRNITTRPWPGWGLTQSAWRSPEKLRRYGASARSARARRSYDRIMQDQP